jgi:serine/threonine protein kinase
MTIATDVYSLGVVLYELLTDQSPYKFVNGPTQEFAQEVCVKRTAEAKPGGSSFPRDTTGSLQTGTRAFRNISHEKLSWQLRGDIDNIVLMALRKEPARRYASANELQEDIQRHLENIPVHARNDSAWYRTTKFVARHKAWVAASVLVMLAMMTGLIVTLHEARVARTERARAERRFNDVRKLAKSLMFEVRFHRGFAGTLPAKLLVNRALEYLDSLSQEASGDAGLQRRWPPLMTGWETFWGTRAQPILVTSREHSRAMRKAYRFENHPLPLIPTIANAAVCSMATSG